MAYKYIEGFTMADIAFEATGSTIEELFISSGEALTNTMVKGLDAIGTSEERRFTIEAKDEEWLLHGFLQELIFYKDAELLIFRKYDLKIAKGGKGLILTAVLKGEHIDPKKHDMLVDAKAISWHMFKAGKEGKNWKAFVIVDV
jgi:SHS2 domain-containing protein